MDEDRQHYDLDGLRNARACLGKVLDVLEAEPTDGGAFISTVNVRPRGLTVHLNWKPALPVTLPQGANPAETPSTMALKHFGMDPVFVWNLIDQLVATMEET